MDPEPKWPSRQASWPQFDVATVPLSSEREAVAVRLRPGAGATLVMVAFPAESQPNAAVSALTSPAKGQRGAGRLEVGTVSGLGAAPRPTEHRPRTARGMPSLAAESGISRQGAESRGRERSFAAESGVFRQRAESPGRE